MNVNPCDVLILTASFGNGHNSATKAIVEKIESLFPDMQVHAVDMFDITTPKLKDYLFETYNLLTRTKLPLYNQLYHLRNTKDNMVDDLMLKLYYKRFEKYVSAYKPGMIISVFPTCAQFSAHFKATCGYSVKTVTVITDVVGSWEWINQGTDMYCVPASDVKESLMAKGIPGNRIFITGVPVSHAFKAENHKTTDYQHVLMMASAMGKLNFNQRTLDTLGEMPYRFTIVTGKNKDLYQKIMDFDLADNITVIGYTTAIPDLMKAADLVVTKPGGATIFEAIESNVPLLIKPSNNGQETYNVEFINKYGFGDTFNGRKDLVEKIEKLLSNQEEKTEIIENMNHFKANTQRDEAFTAIGQMVAKSKGLSS